MLFYGKENEVKIREIESKNEKKKKIKTIYNKLRTNLLGRRVLVERIYQIFTMLLRIEMFEEWFESLDIHFEGLPSVRIFNLHGFVWINYLNDE